MENPSRECALICAILTESYFTGLNARLGAMKSFDALSEILEETKHITDWEEYLSNSAEDTDYQDFILRIGYHAIKAKHPDAYINANH